MQGENWQCWVQKGESGEEKKTVIPEMKLQKAIFSLPYFLQKQLFKGHLHALWVTFLPLHFTACPEGYLFNILLNGEGNVQRAKPSEMEALLPQ